MTLTHVDSEGRSRMVDVSGKPITRRTAVASGLVRMSPATVQAIKDHRTPKGDPLEISRIAGVMGAKRTSDLIPLCHPLPLNQANVELEILSDGVLITATATTEGKTGVEMEALTAVSISALTLYDMCKAIDKSMVISDIKLESKTGGTSGDFKREQAGEVG